MVSGHTDRYDPRVLKSTLREASVIQHSISTLFRQVTTVLDDLEIVCNKKCLADRFEEYLCFHIDNGLVLDWRLSLYFYSWLKSSDNLLVLVGRAAFKDFLIALLVSSAKAYFTTYRGETRSLIITAPELGNTGIQYVKEANITCDDSVYEVEVGACDLDGIALSALKSEEIVPDMIFISYEHYSIV